EVWPFPCMVVITSGKTLDKRKEQVWAALDAQREAIAMLEDEPAKAAPLITQYFIKEPTLKTLNQGEVSSEKVIEQAIQTQDFSSKLTKDDIDRMKELAKIMQEQGVLPAKDGPFDVDGILDLSWQEARKL